MDTLENTQTTTRTPKKHGRFIFFFLSILILAGAITWIVIFMYESPQSEDLYPLPEGFELV